MEKEAIFVSEERLKEYRAIQVKYADLMAEELTAHNFLPIPLYVGVGKLYNKDEYLINHPQCH